MTLDIYWGSGSGPAWRVLLAAGIKGLPFNSHLLSFSDREHKTEQFLAINPRGQVPAIVHDGFALNESLAILAYLDAAFPESPKLLGTDAQSTGRIWAGIFMVENYFAEALNKVRRPIFNGKTEGFDAAEYFDVLRKELDGFNEVLSGRQFLQGDGVTAHDVVLAVHVMTLERAIVKAPEGFLPADIASPRTTWPALGAWCLRMEAQPGWDAAYPPHWRG
jgi:glutathione S-transferase